MREIGISPRFSRDKFVPLQTKQRYSTRDISGEVFLTLFFRGFVPFLSLADFVSRDKNLQVVDLQRLKSCFEELVTATTSNHQKEPSGELLEAINRNFGSLDELKVQIGRAAAGLFGSGWVWLAEDPSGRLAVVSEQNAGNPMRHGMKPLLAIDVWEHAYYIDYRNRRADAVEALWGVVDWKVVGDRYAEK